MQDRLNELNKKQLDQTKSTNAIMAGLAEMMKEKEEGAEKQKEEKEERKKSYREKKGPFAKVLFNIVQKQNVTNQTVPHSIISSGTSAVNISTITSNSSR